MSRDYTTIYYINNINYLERGIFRMSDCDQHKLGDDACGWYFPYVNLVLLLSLQVEL